MKLVAWCAGVVVGVEVGGCVGSELLSWVAGTSGGLRGLGPCEGLQLINPPVGSTVSGRSRWRLLAGKWPRYVREAGRLCHREKAAESVERKVE